MLCINLGDTKMKIMVINGSPRIEKSNTIKLTNAFIDGLNEAGNNTVEKIDVYKKNIKPCQGCFGCWKKTPGKCVISDDMEEIYIKYFETELIIWSFPLYYYGMPSQVKALVDRLFPNNYPEIINVDGRAGHPLRHDKEKQKHVLISTCGFFTINNNYEALVKQYEIMFGDRFVKILTPEGELFNIPQLSDLTGKYFLNVKEAGREYIKQGYFSENIEHKLNEPLFQAEQFIEMANAHWK